QRLLALSALTPPATLGGEPRQQTPEQLAAAALARQQREERERAARQAQRDLLRTAILATATPGSTTEGQGDKITLGTGTNRVTLSLEQARAIAGTGGLQAFIAGVMRQAPSPPTVSPGLNGLSFNMAEYVANALQHAGVQFDRQTLMDTVNARMRAIEA